MMSAMCVLLNGAFAQADTGSDGATVRFLTGMPGNLDWRARGDVEMKRQFCVESSTGHFVLAVSSATGGLNGQATIPYEVTVEINGRVRSGVISQASPVFSVQGEADRESNCTVPSNVGQLTVRLLQKDAMGAVSGSYADQLRVTVASN